MYIEHIYFIASLFCQNIQIFVDKHKIVPNVSFQLSSAIGNDLACFAKCPFQLTQSCRYTEIFAFQFPYCLNSTKIKNINFNNLNTKLRNLASKKLTGRIFLAHLPSAGEK